VHRQCDFERDPPFYPIHVVYQLEVSLVYVCYIVFKNISQFMVM
jgi:hypothetical protein